MTTAPTARKSLFALEIPDDARVGAVAAETSMGDRGLDALEEELSRADRDVHARLGAALQLARAGRKRSGPALAALRRDLQKAGLEDEAKVVLAALDLLALRPPPRLERADSGYRWSDDEIELYVEDPLAQHWHALGRWGPPIRPDLDRPPRLFGPRADDDPIGAFAAEGGVVVVPFSASPYWRPAPAAVRVTRAGFARDAALVTLTRWADLASLGWIEHGTHRNLAYEVRGESERGLPPSPICGEDRLMALFERLLRLQAA